MTPPINLMTDPMALKYLAKQAGISEELAQERLNGLVAAFGPDAAVIYADLQELGEEMAGWR